jgi:hypothetical protein
MLIYLQPKVTLKQVTYIYSIIKADYLQRTRSYGFLITLAITIYAAYSFVPPPSAHYTTLNVVGFKGVYNSPWVGNVSAMMTTIMLSLYGFFLITGGIKKDMDTEVGLIVAATPLTNFSYLLCKALSNFAVLVTIMSCTFVVSIIMFFIRSNGYPFVLTDFVFPYLLLSLPALLLISALAVVSEVALGRRSILQYISFIFLFGAIMARTHGEKNDTIAVITDPFGLRTITTSVMNTVNSRYHADIKDISLGFTFSSKHNAFKTFTWMGITWTSVFLLSRLAWIFVSLGLVYISSFFFHRFDYAQRTVKTRKKTKVANLEHHEELRAPHRHISMAAIPAAGTNYSIMPFIKTELLLLIRKGSMWFWLINAALCIATLFAPMDVAHLYLLPILWFLQVTRWSELATKEKTNRLHYFTYASYKPLQRMLPAQILAGVILALALAMPLMIRYAIGGNASAVLSITNGAIFIVLLAVCMGIVSGSKKLFEIIFFLLTYIITQKATPADYLGAMHHNNNTSYLFIVLGLSIFLALISFSVRNYQARHL